MQKRRFLLQVTVNCNHYKKLLPNCSNLSKYKKRNFHLMKPLPSLAMPLLSNSVSDSSINDNTPKWAKNNGASGRFSRHYWEDKGMEMG